MAEMAREFLKGRTDLRTISQGSVYARPLTEAADKFQDWHAALSPEDRASLERDGHERLDGR